MYVHKVVLLMALFNPLVLSLGDTDWESLAQNEFNQVLNQRINTNAAKNIILFLGDGMGVSTVTAARILYGQLQGRLGEESYLSFETFPHTSLIKTYCSDRTTPDSASTATALLCGIKTNYHTLGVRDTVTLGNCSSQFGAEVSSILDWFNEAGKATGLVSTSRITHATPGAGYGHVADRDWEGDSEMENVEGGCKDMAYQLIMENKFIKVLFGGGRYYFLPNTTGDPKYGMQNADKQRRDNMDLVQEWENDKARRGYKGVYMWNRGELLGLDPDSTDFALGLFNDGHMNFELDRDNSSTGEPSLTEMTSKAIRILQKNDKGYFLLVEGGRIDSAHHDNNAKRALYDTLAFDNAIKTALKMVNEEETLVLVTADHSHVFNIAGYPRRGNSLFGYVDPIKDKHVPKDGIPWTTLLYGNGPGYDWGQRTRKTEAELESKEYIQSAAAPRDSETHGGEDVVIYARGPMAHLINGVHEQNFVNFVMTYASCVGRHTNNCAKHAKAQEFNNSNRVTVNSFYIVVFISFKMFTYFCD